MSTSELELVNHLLRVVGDDTTSTLETEHPSVVQAKRALEGYSKDFQSKGWWFNRDFGVKLVPDTTGRIALPPDYLEFTPADPVHGVSGNVDKKRYVRRKGRIYDTVRNTDVIGHSLVVDVLLFLPIEDLPDIAAAYLKHWAAAEYYLDDDGDIAKRDRLQERRENAWADLQAVALRATKPNKLQTPFGEKLRYRIGQHGSPSNPVWPGGRRL